jgi:hypothetical protein
MTQYSKRFWFRDNAALFVFDLHKRGLFTATMSIVKYATFRRWIVKWEE